ncbi:MAG TPA: DUF948 domain-containing protein [Gemmatimonadaceae bacterium]|nr:DUF948 domain-containing protein [Gemmatimonadaceae bacterium]
MISVLAPVGALLVQSAGAARDTVYVAASSSVFADIAAIAQVILALATLGLVAIVLPAAWKLRHVDQRVHRLLETVQHEIAPAMRRAGQIADDVHAVTRTVRGNMDRVDQTIAAANERVENAVRVAEDRLNEFNALLAVVQEEAESLFLSAASTVHAVRGGAAAFRDETDLEQPRRSRPARPRSGMDLASDELEAAAEADELETEEEADGHDGNPEPAAEALSGAPRIRPRPRDSRRA